MTKQATMFETTPQNTELTKLAVDGKLPTWLQGKLVRNGPALFQLESTKLKHWFDGYGMLHGFLFEDGDVFYQSKYIESEEYLRATETGKVPTVAWGTASDPCRSIFRRFMANFSANPTNTNVNVAKIGDRYFATSDIATINEFDIETMETLSTLTATKGGVMAAHPSYTTDNATWNMTSKFGPVAQNTFVSITDEPAVVKHARFQTKKVYYFHSFGNTDRYMVSIEQPMRLNFAALATSGPKNRSFYECFEWDESFTNTLHVYDRQTGDVTAIDTDLQFFFFHTINSYESDGQLTIDLCGYTTNAIVDDFYVDALSTRGIADEHKASLRRITVDLAQKTTRMHDYDLNFELPNINDAYRNKKHRYAYGVTSPAGDNRLAVRTIKFDYQTNTHTSWGAPDTTVGEPIFIERPEAKAEDDGVLLVQCHNQKSATSCLVVLDAKDLNQVASVVLPQVTPPALHGWFYRVNQP